MTDFTITPMTTPPGREDWLPCDEAHATRWGVVFNNVTVLYETRQEAEQAAADSMLLRQIRDRADRFTWRDGDVEHH